MAEQETRLARVKPADCPLPHDGRRALTATDHRQRAKRRAQARFLRSYREMGPHASLSEAARASKTAWRTLMGWRATDLMFQAHLEDLELAKEEELGDLLEKELISRATEGVDTPLVSMGKIVATVKKKSDTLLLEAVRAKRRQYRRAQQAASAEVGRDAEGQPFVKVYAGFDPDQV